MYSLLNFIITILFITKGYTLEKVLTEQEIAFHLGTKTPYRVVANNNDSIVEYPGKVFVVLIF